MAAVDVAQVEERRAVAQLLQEDAIGPHTQADSSSSLAPAFCKLLPSLAYIMWTWLRWGTTSSRVSSIVRMRS
jgi:hypothetical protein